MNRRVDMSGIEPRAPEESGPFESLVAPRYAVENSEAFWLDHLLAAACEMPIGEGERAVVQFMVSSLATMVPQCRVGARFVPFRTDHGPPSSARRPSTTPAESQTFRCVPEGEDAGTVGADSMRLFPTLRSERAIHVEEGCTLHFASDDADLENDSAPILRVFRRAALVIARGLSLARRHANAAAVARELRAVNAHMVQAEKLATLGQIAAGVVHELNNPLTSIVAYTDWLLRKQGPSGDSDSLERLRRIDESANRILRFTRDLVAYARPSSEKPLPVTLHTVIETALAFCEHVLAESHARVERHFAPSIPLVRGMHEQLVQVFVNLFTNACHAMPPEGGRLIVSSKLADDRKHVVIFVTDNGHGIADDHVSQVFAPFFTTKSDGRGTGLGLSIAKNIMNNHGAEIRAEQAEGGGARFVLVFPIHGS